jgi:hypothetical protein
VRHVRMLGLCLVAIFALGAMVASSALAGPQWVKCEKVGPGHNYTGPNCTKAEKAKPKGGGEYELYKAAEIEAKRVANGKSPGVPFTGHNEGSGGLLHGITDNCGEYERPLKASTRLRCREEKKPEIEEYEEIGVSEEEFYENGIAPGRGPSSRLEAVVECGAESSSGEASRTSEVKNVHVTFTGCNLFGTTPCENAGPEEIQTNELKGKLGYINKSAKEVGVLLEPAVKHGAFATFICGDGTLNFEVGVGNKKEGADWTSTGCAGQCFGTTPEEEKHGGYDGVISPIVPVNQMTPTFTQEYKTEEVYANPTRPGEFAILNVPSHFEGKHIDVLEARPFTTGEETGSFEWSSAGEEITNVVEPEEESEIKA